MSHIEQLKEQKAALEIEIAAAVEAAQARKKALEEQIARERALEIERGKAEIQKLMQLYHLSPEDVFGVSVMPRKKNDTARGGYLPEIRQFYGKG